MFRQSILFSVVVTLLSLWCPTVLAADYSVSLDTLTHIRGQASDASVMTLSLNNVKAISALQFDVTLPNCVTFSYPEVWLNDARTTRSHSISISKLSGSTSKYRVLIASSTAKDLKGNDGPLVYMNLILNTTGSYSGYYYVQVTNIIASEADETQHTITSANGVVRYGYIVGDVNGDATVDIADYMATASKILGYSPSPFYSDAANVNNISSIDVSDLVGIANISLGIRPITYRFGTSGNMSLNDACPNFKTLEMSPFGSKATSKITEATSSDRLYIEDFSIELGETLSVPVLLDNDVIYSGFQTDIYLPEGLSIEEDDDEYIIDLTARKDNSHSIACWRQSNGAIRVYVSSSSTAPFNGNSGAIMTISLKAADSFRGPATIALRNTICAEPIGTRHVLQDETCIVNGGASSAIRGDVDGDGLVNISDVTALIDYLLSGNTSGVNVVSADVDGDNSVNISDVTALIDYLLTGHWSEP